MCFFFLVEKGIHIHFATGVYQTNEYGEGGTLLFKGYMPHILESLSKCNGIIVDCDGHNIEAEMLK